MLKNLFKNKRNLILCFAIILCISLLDIVAIGFCLLKKARAEFSDVVINDTYAVGEELEIPYANLTVNGMSVPADAFLIMPDGNVVDMDRIVFAQAGRYELRYQAKADGRFYRQSIYFNVVEDSFSVRGKADYFYGTNSYLPNINGLNVTMGEGGVFRYNKPIDFRDYTANDYFVKFYITPKETGIADLGTVIIKLIDAHDTNNVVTISNNGIFDTYVHAKTVSMARVSANGQQLTGLRATYNDLESRYPGTTLLVNNHASYGTDVKSSIYGTPNCDFEDSFVGFRFDLLNKAVYANGSPLRRDYYNNVDWNVDEQQSYKDALLAGKPSLDMVADLDDPNHFSNLWEGFTTGEVFIEIHFEQLFKSEASVFITSLGGLQGEDFNDPAEVDRSLPELIVESDFYFEDQSMPNAVVGSPYTIPYVRSYDVYNAHSKVKTKVYQAYGSSNQVEIMINSDGTFTPVYAGRYSIVYSSCNRYGDIVEKVLSLTAVSPTDVLPLAIEYNDSAETSCYVGKSFKIADYNVYNAIGGETITITVNGEEVKAGSKFSPEKEGIYTIKYVVKDFSGREAEKEYTVNVVKYGGPLFIDTLDIPKYFSANMKYNLPEYFAYEFTTGEKRSVSCGFPEITDKNGTHTLTGYEYIPKVDKDGDVITVRYRAQFGGYTEIIERDIPCYIVYDNATENVDLSKLFIGSTGVTAEKRNNNIRYSFSSDATLEYINAFDFKQLNYSFNPISDEGSADFSKLIIYINGVANSEQSLKITYTPTSDNKTTVSINGEKPITINNSILTNLNNKFTVKYDNGGVNVATGVTLKAKGFSGFDGNKVYLKMEFVGVRAKVEYSFSSFNGHTLSGATKDNTAPVLLLSGIYSGEVGINCTNVFAPQFAMDVVDPNVTNIKFTLTDDSGTFMKDLNGVELNAVDARKEYVVLFNEYGNYIVTYTATDCFGKKSKLSQYIRVVDHIAPKIELTTNPVQVGSVNSEIVIAEVGITESESDPTKVQYYVFIIKDGNYTIVVDGKFTPTEKGKYKVVYYAFDVNYNYSTLTYEINVD